MKLFIVAYDLNREVDDSDRESIRSLVTGECGNHKQLSESCYLFTSELSNKGLFDKFKIHLDDNDTLTVLKVNPEGFESTLGTRLIIDLM